MEEEYYLDRAELRRLMQEHAEWGPKQLAQAVKRSLAWVKKWVKRLRAAAPDDEQVLHSLSRAPKHPPERIGPEAIQRVLELRASPPDNLKRIPGPRTILYWLKRDQDLQARGVRVPRSPSKVWEILKQYGCIVHPPPHDPEPLERPEPMTAWGIDFKDVSSVPPDPDGKRLHVVETFDVVDHGTSILLDNPCREDFTAETALLTLAETLLVHGMPESITFDRDPRFVGSWSGHDFPTAFVRFLICLGIHPDICPPQRPDRNPFVERFHRTYEYECLRIYLPRDVSQAREVNKLFRHHYNFERPNQAVSCGNQPPSLAHTTLPTLPRVPDIVDPDGWLTAYHHRTFKRRVNSNGMVQLGKQSYYVGQRHRGRYVLLQVDAAQRQLIVLLDYHRIKQLAIKGLHGALMRFQSYLDLIRREAASEWRLWLYRARQHKATMFGSRSR